MNARHPLILAAAFFLLSLLTLGGLLLYQSQPKGEPLLVYGEAPDFVLTAQDGTSFDDKILDDKIWVADFFFSSCPGPCPKMAANMSTLQEQFKNRDDVRLVNFSVDPDRDTPEVLTHYAAKLGADTSRWHFLIGSKDEIQRVSVDGFKLGNADDIMFHSEKFALVDRKGKIRGYYEGTNPEDTLRLADDIRRLIKE